MGIGQPTLAPFLDTRESTLRLNHRLELFHKSGNTLFTLRGIDDIDDLILTGILSHCCLHLLLDFWPPVAPAARIVRIRRLDYFTFEFPVCQQIFCEKTVIFPQFT